MTDRLPFLGAGIALFCLALFLWAATAGPGAVEWPPTQEVPCIGGMGVDSFAVGRDYVLNSSYSLVTNVNPMSIRVSTRAAIYFEQNGTATVKTYEAIFVPQGEPVPEGYYWQPGITDEEKIHIRLHQEAGGCRLGRLDITYNSSGIVLAALNPIVPIEVARRIVDCNSTQTELFSNGKCYQQVVEGMVRFGLPGDFS